MESIDYQKLKIINGGHHFSLFCSRQTLAEQREEVVLWADGLARRLGWTRYDMVITDATQIEARKRKQAIFEHRLQVL